MPNDPGIYNDSAPLSSGAVDRKTRTRKLIAHKNAPRWEGADPPPPSEWTRQRTANMRDRKSWQAKRVKGKLVPRRECASGRELLEAKAAGRYAYPLVARLGATKPHLPPRAKYEWRDVHTTALAWITFGQLVLDRAAVIITHDEMAELLGAEANTGRYRGRRPLTERHVGTIMRELVDWGMLEYVQPTFRKFCKKCSYIFPAEQQLCGRCRERHTGRGVRLYRHANVYAVTAVAANAFKIGIAAIPSVGEICTAAGELRARRRFTRKGLPGKPQTTLRVDSGRERDPCQSGLSEVAASAAPQNLLSPGANESTSIVLSACDRASTPAVGLNRPRSPSPSLVSSAVLASTKISDALPGLAKLPGLRSERERQIDDARDRQKRAGIRAYLERRELDKAAQLERDRELMEAGGREAVRIENDRLRRERELRDRGRARERGEDLGRDEAPPAPPAAVSEETLEQLRRDRERLRYEPTAPRPPTPEEERKIAEHIERKKTEGWKPPAKRRTDDEPLWQIMFRTLESRLGVGKIGPVDLEIIAKMRRDEEGGGE